MDTALLVIVAPESAEAVLQEELLALGVEGFTAWTVRGYGQHGRRPTTWASPNVRIEALTPRDVAVRAVAALRAKHPREQGVFVYATAEQTL